MRNTTLYLLCAALLSGCQFLEPDYLHSISPTALQAVLQSKDILLVDVHTPEQKHIPGTDFFVPYDAIPQQQDKFPADKQTPIYVYCEGGPMGNAAARELHALGYQNIFNLSGGSHAWQKAGLCLAIA